MAGKLYGEITSKSVRALDDNGTNAIACDPIEHGHEARPSGHDVSTGNASVVELGNNLVAVRPSECLGRGALALVRILVAADDVGGRGGPQVSDRGYLIARHDVFTI